MRHVFLSLLLLVAGCRCNDDRTAQPPAAGSAAEEDVILPALPPVEIGMADAPATPANAAATLHAEGLSLFKKGDFMAARRTLMEVVKLAPELQQARYDLARAHVKVGAFDDAAAELARLLAADLRDWQGRVGRDTDLAKFRATPAGLALRHRTKEIEAAYEDARAKGLRTFMWRGFAERANLALHTQVLRLGVFLPETKRFVPLTSSVDNAYAIAVDPDGTTEVVVDFLLNPINGSGGAVGQRIDRCGISIAKLDAPFDPRIRWEGRCDEGMLLVPQKAAARFANVDLAPSGQFRWQRVTREGTKPDQDAGTPSEYLEVRTIGVRGAANWGVPWPDARPAVVDAKGVALDGGAPIALPPPHGNKARTSAWSSPDGRRIVVVSLIDEDVKVPFVGWKVKHAVSLVDVEKREATLLVQGDGPAHAAFAPDGTLYLQSDRKVRRRAPDATTWEPLPGVLIAQPFVSPAPDILTR